MTSATYDLFAKAMAEGKPVRCTYGGYQRIVCPVILGHTKGEEKALVFQTGGQSSKPLPSQGQWRCLKLASVTDAALHDGPWRSGSSHQQAQTCVEDVELDVNPWSPYRRAGGFRSVRRSHETVNR
jgi:hypothetical protein